MSESSQKKLNTEQIKMKTIELYDSLPEDKEERIKCIDIRNKIIELNYSFFGYVASNTFVENAEYNDKMQTALLAFMNMWWKYKWAPKYRTDLSFAAFFKPRLSEEIRRYLGPVSYSMKRNLCIKAAKQLGKPWTEVNYDDLSSINLSPADMIALKSVLCAGSSADLSELETYLEAPEHKRDIDDYKTTQYDSVEELLIQEMIEQESKLSDKHLKYLADLYTIDYSVLKNALPQALKILHDRLTENM